MSVEMRNQFNEAKKKGRTDWWMYSGLVIFILLFTIGWFNNIEKHNSNRELIQLPQYGDVYIIHVDKEYMELQLASSSGTIISFYPSNYTTNNKGRLTMMELSHQNDMFDTGTLMSYTQSGLMDMLDKNIIIEVKRVSTY